MQHDDLASAIERGAFGSRERADRRPRASASAASADQRRILALRLQAEPSTAQIADKLAIRPGTAGSRLHDALRTLRMVIAGDRAARITVRV